MTIEERSILLDAIGEGNIQSALDKLQSLELNESSKKEVIVISSRFKKLKRQNRLGILSFEQTNLTENQITTHLIDLINQPDDVPFPKDKAINASFPTKPIIWKYITAAAIVIGMLASLAYLIEFINVLPKNQSAEKHQLTVFTTDIEGNVVLEHEGELNTSIGNRPMHERIGEHGRTNFGDILSEYLGDTITIGFKADGWEIVDGKNTFVFSGDPIRLKVKKDDSLGIIKGVVKTRDGQAFISDALVQINNDTTVLTNELGIFKIVLPESMRVTTATQQYDLTIIKEGYKTSNKYYSPKSNTEIRLEKK